MNQQSVRINSYLPGAEFRKPEKHRTPTQRIGIMIAQWLFLSGAVATATIVAIAPQNWINRMQKTLGHQQSLRTDQRSNTALPVQNAAPADSTQSPTSVSIRLSSHVEGGLSPIDLADVTAVQTPTVAPVTSTVVSPRASTYVAFVASTQSHDR